MKRLVIMFAGILMAWLVIRCTKEGTDTVTTDKTEDGTGLYDGFSAGGTGGVPSGSGVRDSVNQEVLDPGQITAAEWNDLTEWDFWINLGQNEAFNTARDNWKFYPLKRYSFLVKDNRLNPLVDCEVILQNLQGDILWQTRTDNQGKAELWLDLNGGNSGTPTAVVRYADQEIMVTDPVTYDEDINTVTMATEAAQQLKADILFVVDATGSMGDEINYLKSELRNVIERAENLHSNLDLRVGSVFYRDEGDEYLTRVSPFSSSLLQTQSFIDNQHADGGGDYEEAVHTALNTAITQLNWSENARARLLFLLLDAPPHHTDPIVNDLNSIVRNAAQKGIKIIPISASGIDKDTEFLFRFFAAATNGTYVFITNDSGIGGEHLEATVGEYEVELLNDLIVRLINENMQ
jgi:hypothetical protein